MIEKPQLPLSWSDKRLLTESHVVAVSQWGLWFLHVTNPLVQLVLLVLMLWTCSTWYVILCYGPNRAGHTNNVG